MIKADSSKNQYANIAINTLLIIAVAVTLISILVPFAPAFPGIGLDASWRFGLNQAVAQHLIFGRDVIFTLGPYASIYTRDYHPVTDALMLAGSLYLALSYSLAIASLIKGVRCYWIIMLCGALTWMLLPDALLFTYPLLISLAAFKTFSLKENVSKNESYLVLLFLFLFAPFGLLPLIKGSLLLWCAMDSFCCCCFFIMNNKKKFAVISILAPIISVALFWVASGQRLINLPEYVISMSSIASGYTEAMMQCGNKLDIILYIGSSLLILIFIVLQRNISLVSRIFLISVFGFFLFIAFKAGFVRHDGHAVIAATAICIAVISLPLVFNSRAILWLVIILCGAASIIESHYTVVRPLLVYNQFIKTYSSAWCGAIRRLQDSSWPKADFEAAMLKLKSQAHFPVLPGTTDIYSYNQSFLIAAGNTWSPRPIFQSYSVYTRALAEKNKNHLLGETAPDNIIFKVEPIDGRLPSLEDGASWPLLLSDYEPAQFSNNFLFLKKKEAINQAVQLITITSEQCSLGEVVALPAQGGLLFAEATIKPTLIGRLADFFFKPSRIKVTLHLKNGTTKEEALVAGMTQAGFLISPFIENTAEFKSLYDGSEDLDGNKVLSFSIHTSKHDLCWKSKYTLLLKTMVAPSAHESSITDKIK